jgi:hypothetical protein
MAVSYSVMTMTMAVADLLLPFVLSFVVWNVLAFSSLLMVVTMCCRHPPPPPR